MADLNELNTHAAEEPVEDQEYIDQMVAKAEGVQPTVPEEEDEVEEEVEEEESTTDESPDWLPEKFKSPEELAKAYTELEKKLGNKDKEGGKEEINTPQDPMDYQSLTEEYWERGELSGDSYENLEKMGIPKHIVDAHIEGQNAVLNQVQNSVYKEVGGEAQYQEMMSWAKDNLTEAEVHMYDQSVNTNSLDQTLYAVKGLHARFASEVGIEPTLVQGDTAPSNSGAYASAAEVKQDMSDRRYSTDPAFRDRVARKLAKSNVF
jgi:chromosome segregation ATPase